MKEYIIDVMYTDKNGNALGKILGEITHCSECKHYHPNAKNTVMNCRNSHGLLHATEDDYCSKAERK